MNYEFLEISIVDHIAEVSMNRPDKANSITETGFRELEAIFGDLDANDDVRVIILTGNGKHFCGGIDLELLLGIDAKVKETCDGRKREKLMRLIKQLQAPMDAIEACSKPVIAMIHGGCLGAGLDLIAACDLRYASSDAYFCIKEIDLGMVADLGSLQRLPKFMQPAAVAEYAFTGATISYAAAATTGLINRGLGSREESVIEVRKVAQQIASKSPLSIRGTKQTLLYARDHTVADSLHQITLWNAAMILSEDLLAAGRAAMMKTTPTFRG